MNEKARKKVELIEKICKTCHEVNRAIAVGHGDKSHKEWAKATQGQRESTLKGVKLLLKDSSLTPKKLHEEWCREKVNNGWSYGKVKDEVKKEHPCLVPYSTLSPIDRAKDTLFLAVVKSFKRV